MKVYDRVYTKDRGGRHYGTITSIPRRDGLAYVKWDSGMTEHIPLAELKPATQLYAQHDKALIRTIAARRYHAVLGSNFSYDTDAAIIEADDGFWVAGYVWVEKEATL